MFRNALKCKSLRIFAANITNAERGGFAEPIASAVGYARLEVVSHLGLLLGENLVIIIFDLGIEFRLNDGARVQIAMSPIPVSADVDSVGIDLE